MGIINFGEFLLFNFIELVVWVVVGGCVMFYGVVIGVILVNYGKIVFIGVMLEVWLFVLGGLFVVVIVFLL